MILEMLHNMKHIFDEDDDPKEDDDERAGQYEKSKPNKFPVVVRER